MLNSESKYCTFPTHNYLLINKQQKKTGSTKTRMLCCNLKRPKKVLCFFLKREQKRHTTHIYRSTSAATTSSSICNSAFVWRFTSHGGWPSRFESEIAVVAVQLVVSDSDFGSRGRASEVTLTGHTLKTI